MENFITEIDILDESKECFLTYASEVLTDRAIPAAEDGLLSSQRKILWTMSDYLKMNSKGKTKKCNGIVGSTLATSYFHGDSSCYGVLCKMSQKYLMRYPLIEGQGSLGTQEDNDLVASSRYTEAKPSIYTDLMMLDYKKQPVPTKETYNGEFMEPVVLPGLFPNALCNGRQAIGISMAHNSCPHNLAEVCDAISAYIDNPNLTIDDIMQYIKGPDFPLPNTIINQKDIRTALATGKSHTSLKIRGEYEVNGDVITFNSIPYRTYRNKIKEQLEKNVAEFETVLDDYNDESNLGVNKLVFYAKPGQASTLLNRLFKYTDLQSTVSYNMNYIVNGTPKLCSIKDLIIAYVNHQHNVMINIAKVDLDKAKAREHVIEGLLLAIKDIDKAIQLIKASMNKEEARTQLIDYFKITEVQANAVLDMRLSKLTKLDKDDLLKELEEVKLAIAKYTQIIEDKSFRDKELKEKVNELKNKYGDARRTTITQIEDSSKDEKEVELIEPKDVVVVLTKTGMIKKIPTASFRVQKRNGAGVKTQEDIVLNTIKTNTIDYLLVFTTAGKMYRLLVDDIPDGTNVSKGIDIKTLLPKVESNERAVLALSLERGADNKYIVFATKNGMIKKSYLSEYKDFKKRMGIVALKMKDGDSLADIIVSDNENVVVTTHKGMAINFSLSEVAPTSRVTIGVKSISLTDNDFVTNINLITPEVTHIGVVYTDGLGKKVKVSEIPAQKRGGKGVTLTKDKEIVGTVSLSKGDNVLICSSQKGICIPEEEIPEYSRIAVGNALLKNGNVISIARV